MVNDTKIQQILSEEAGLFRQRTPNSYATHSRAKVNWLSGVPMHWMVDWQLEYPVYIADAQGITLTDVDGNRYLDFCLGDTGSMFGHTPPPMAEALSNAAQHGLTTMLPSPDAEQVGEMLRDRFGMTAWQITATASDANRAIIRWCRAITQRKKILVYNQCYHGSVDETLVSLEDGQAWYDPALNSGERLPATNVKVIEFNDIAALRAALVPGDVACVLAEPVMTNVGMVLPDPGYLQELRKITRETGTLLIIDETHTISSGPGGYCRVIGLEADGIVMGKPVAGGLPTGVYGFSAAAAERLNRYVTNRIYLRSGTVTTLAGSAIQLAMMKFVLAHYFTDASFTPMIAGATRMETGIAAIIARYKLPWHVVRVGARVEFMCTPNRPRNGGEASLVIQRPIDIALHNFLLNRGILITPFHNMMLISPSTQLADIDEFLRVFEEAAERLSK
ncbi:MAG: transaminase [Alphaproteobacteria bacterium]|nr:transaminase [Alphaproteobacteria bacterium]